MKHPLQSRAGVLARGESQPLMAPDLMVDLEADNVLLRAALATSRTADAQRDLVTQELQHRIGNILAVVHAIARQTFKDAGAGPLDDFGARIQALSAAQKILLESEIRPAMMGDVVAEALAPHTQTSNRFRFSGPELMLNGRRAHALTLALHELATNAAKYGALSQATGHVDVSWSMSGDRLDFRWREYGGPAVRTPTRRSFGAMLITRNLGMAFSGDAVLDFRPDGVEARLTAPAQPAV